MQNVIAEIHVLSAAVMQTVFKESISGFERSRGHKVVFVYATMGAITERLLGGESADLVIGSTPSLARLEKEGKVLPASLVTVARVGVGAVVPSGTPVPAFATPVDVRRALLAAKTVVYANPAGGGAAGIHVAKVIERLGVAGQVKAKTRFGAGGDVTEVALAQGPGTLGLTQISAGFNAARGGGRTHRIPEGSRRACRHAAPRDGTHHEGRLTCATS